eukprot:g31383.t1
MSTLLKEFGPLEGRLLKQCSEGVLEGLNYLHTRDPPVVHRDIKGANILVDLSFNVKLSDFGWSIPWMAPEVILQRDGYGRKADVWSFGCADAFENVMYALKHISMTDAIPPIPEMDEVSDAFLRACLQRVPKKRPSSAELLKHPWTLGGWGDSRLAVEIFSPLTRTENGNENKVFLVNGNGNKALSEAQACVILQRPGGRRASTWKADGLPASSWSDPTELGFHSGRCVCGRTQPQAQEDPAEGRNRVALQRWSATRTGPLHSWPILRLEMQGSCASCSSSAITVKMGIERTMLDRFPEIYEVEAVMPGFKVPTEEGIEEVLSTIGPFLSVSGGSIELIELDDGEGVNPRPTIAS